MVVDKRPSTKGHCHTRVHKRRSRDGRGGQTRCSWSGAGRSLAGETSTCSRRCGFVTRRPPRTYLDTLLYSACSLVVALEIQFITPFDRRSTEATCERECIAKQPTQGIKEANDPTETTQQGQAKRTRESQNAEIGCLSSAGARVHAGGGQVLVNKNKTPLQREECIAS